MKDPQPAPRDYAAAIKASGLSIYDHIEIGSDLWIPSPELQILLDGGLVNLSTAGLPLRTRSKVVKTRICEVLGYPTPLSFQKTQPRFTGQQFDTYVQGSNNLQIWNEELSATRRYVLIREGPNKVITRVKVVTGETLAALDTTGTLTQKYQARLNPGAELHELVSAADTERLIPHLTQQPGVAQANDPLDYPAHGSLLPIAVLFQKLSPLVGRTFVDAGADQERNRGAGLHRLVCQALGYTNYADDGRFPDVRHQLLEVKLQTSPTIDLGLALPTGEDVLDVPQIDGTQVRHCDVRYALFGATTDGELVTLTRFYLTSGRDFFTRFPQFGGKKLNKKLQIPLPRTFFDQNAEGGTDILL